MTKTDIYIYKGEGGYIETPIKLQLQAEKQMVRLIADAGKMLTDGVDKTTAIDIELSDVNKWTEINE